MAVTEELRAEVVTPSARPARARRLIPIMVGVASLAVFGVVQLIIERRLNSSWVRPPGAPRAHFVVDWPAIRYQLAGDLARFIALSLAGVALVIHRRRWFFWLPAVAYVFGPLILGWGDTDCQVLGRLPATVGEGWWGSPALGCPSATAGAWGPALWQLALVLAPALVLAVRSWSPSPEPLPQPRGRSPEVAVGAAALALVGFAVWATFWAWRLAGRMPTPLQAQVPKVLPLLAFGVVLGTLNSRIAWTLPVVAILLATDWPQIPLLGLGIRTNWSLWEGFVSSLPYTWPFVMLPVLAASWKPLAQEVERLRTSPRPALVVLNTLNLADALFTSFALRAEGALEANPFVRLIGLPAKVLLVAGLSLVLYRIRPRALAWLILAFGAVFVWHLAGSFASPR